MTELVEPAPAHAAGVGSTESGTPGVPPPPTAQRDLLRTMACALLVAVCVQSPASALLVAPFVPALVAIRLVRRIGNRRFLWSVVPAGVVAAVLASTSDEVVPAAVASALLLVWLLAVVHVHASRHDPASAQEPPDWPEPRVATGLTPTIAAWVVAVALVATIAWATGATSPAAAVTADAVDEAYSPYTQACAEDGALVDQQDLCERLDEQRETMVELVEDHASELLAGIAALFAFGAAATTHLVVLARARRLSDRVRPGWKLEELELHWSFAYVLAAGLVGWLLADPMTGDALVATRSVAVALMVLGGLAVVSQGVGLFWWISARGRRPTLSRTLVIVAALVVSPIVAAMLFVLGVLDLAVHPRRRAAAA